MDMHQSALVGAPVAPSHAAKSGITFAQLASAYQVAYDGRDRSRATQVAWWVERLGERSLAELIEQRERTDLDVHNALEALASSPAMRWTGKRDAGGKPVRTASTTVRSGATVNRYACALASVFKFARRKRLVPRDFKPLAGQERRRESNGRVRFLSPDERTRLFTVCREYFWIGVWPT